MKRFFPLRAGLLAAAGLALVISAPVSSPPAAAATFTIDIPNCSVVTATGSGSTISINCTTVSAPPPSNGSAPSSCSAFASPSTLGSSGGTISLSASCAGGSAPTSVTWTRNGVAIAGSTDTLPANTSQSAANYSYVATLSNANGSATASASVSVAGAAGTGGGTGGGTFSCSGFARTVVLDLPWVSTTVSSRLQTASAGGLGPNDALIVRFTVPAGVASTSAGSMQLAEWGGGPVMRFAALSQTPCDFNHSQWGVDAWNGTTLTVNLQVGGTSSYLAALQPGTTYYLNVRNTDRYGNPTGGGCDGGLCNMYVDFTKPPGT